MTKRKTKAAMAASRVLDDSTPYAVWNVLNVFSDVFGSEFLAKMRNDFTKYIEDSKTAAASALEKE